MGNGNSTRPTWALLGIAVVAFVGLTSTLATRITPPSVPESIAPSIAAVLVGFTLIGVGSLLAFLWRAILRDESGAA